MMRDLTKWPRLLVAGENVTPEQADEILIRTCIPAYLNCNDPEWNEQVRQAMGFVDDTPPRELYAHGKHDERIEWAKERWAHNYKRSEALGIIGLTYVYNARIASSWIGGAFGWCDWDGTVGSSNFNIGKWPSHEDVTEEWQDIATAFPFLDLTAQLIADEGGGDLVGQWRVCDGRVQQMEPRERITTPTDLTTGDFIRCVTGQRSERGVSFDRLTAAVRRVEEKMKGQTP